MVTININNRNLYFIAAVFILIIGGGIVFAYNQNGAGNPQIMGHSADEIEDFNETVISIIQGLGIGEMVCSKNPFINSSASNATVYNDVHIPTSFVDKDGNTVNINCIQSSIDATGGDCILKIIYLDSKDKPIRFEYCYYNQDPATKRWTCVNKGNGAYNGYPWDAAHDTSAEQKNSVNYISTRVANSDGTKVVGLADDWYSNKAQSVRRSADYWAYRDSWTGAGELIYLCKDTSFIDDVT